MRNILNIQEIISKNKIQLQNYLLDFHPDKITETALLFSDDDLKCGYFVFKGLMKSKINMPKIGKMTVNYWVSRGWSKKESEEQRVKIKKDPSTSPMNLNYWIKKGRTEDEAKFEVRSQRKLNKEYWIKRGHNEVDSILMVKNFQNENNNKLCEKYKNDIDFKNDMKKKQNMCIEYWLENGFNEEDAKLKISERQSTFSMKKCIENYGEVEGMNIWKNRQDKWIESLSKSSYNGYDGKDSKSIIVFKKKYGEDWINKFIERNFKNTDVLKSVLLYESYQEMIDNLLLEKYSIHDIYLKIGSKLIIDFYATSFEDMYSYLLEKSGYTGDVRSIDYFKNKYGEDWINKFILISSFKNKEEIRSLLLYNTYQEMIDSLINKFSITEISVKIKGALISNFYKTTFEEMFGYLIKCPIIIKSKFGNMRYFNGHLCRSDGEFTISKFLVDKNIRYQYEKEYPNSKKRCDFYLKDYNIYVEYLGMISIPSKSKDTYLNKYENKRIFCLENNIKHIFSKNLNDIKKMIEDEIINNDRTTK